MTDGQTLTAAGLTVMDNKTYNAARFDSCQLLAEQMGLPTFAEWTAGLQRAYDRMPAWYWHSNSHEGPEHRYCNMIADKIAWHERHGDTAAAT